MDTETPDFEKLRDAHRRMAEFIAYCEVAEGKVGQWMQSVQQTIENNQKVINEQLLQISQATNEVQEVISYFNTAKLKINVEKALQKNQQQINYLGEIGKQHLKSLEANNMEFQKLAKRSFERLDRASTYTIKNISDAISSFRISDFQKYTEQSCDLVKETSRSTMHRLREMVRWFHWKNLSMVAAVTLFVTLSMGLYLNDEMPWEIHKRVAMQRNAGQALINAWPSLSQEEQKRIIKQSKKPII